MKSWFKCFDCNEYFEDKEAIRLVERETGYTDIMCPCCRGTDVESVNTCPMCGNPTENEDICDDCRSALVDEVDDVIDSMITDGDRDAAHEAAKQFLCDAWTGVLK